MAPMKFSPPAGRRGGFTLVELLVAAGLSVLVMAILATAFQQGMETLSHLKSTVTLSQQLRGVEAVIRADLAGRHLEDGSSGDTVLVSNLKKIGQTGWRAPDKGYFRLDLGAKIASPLPTPPTGPAFFLEGSDNDESVYYATNHSMRFTVRLLGGAPQDVVTAFIPLNGANSSMPQLMLQSQRSMVDSSETQTRFAGEWAEIGYFLETTGLTSSNEDGTAGFPLYKLHRRIRALAPNARDQQLDTASGFTADSYPEVSLGPWSYPSNYTPPPYAPNVTPPTVTAGSPQFVNTPASVNEPVPLLPANPPSQPNPYPYPPGTSPQPANRPPLASIPFTNDLAGSDVLLTNVISMQIRPLLEPVPTTAATGSLPSLYTSEPVATNGTPWHYDTFDPAPVDNSATLPPTPRIRLKAVQLKLRIYDVRNRATRQVTIAQDL